MNRFFVRISFYQVIILSLIWMPFCVSFRPCAHPTGSLTKEHILPFIRLTTIGKFPCSSSLAGKKFETEAHKEKQTIYRLLCTPRDKNRKPGGSNIFFYNDEVASHLHGYMFLVGGLLALDETFVLVFCAFASAAAGATLAGIVPANPRVPAIVAMLTLMITCLLRFVIGYEFLLVNGDSGPSESALALECAVCALNIAWGMFGSWKTKEPTEDGATSGF